MKCPNCSLDNSDADLRCSCGYKFHTGTIKEIKKCTCNACKTVWFVNQDEVDSEKSIASLNTGIALLNTLSGSSITTAVSTNNAMQGIRKIGDLLQCPQCKSKDFSVLDIYFDINQPILYPPEKEKECVMCKEVIKLDAAKCRFCGYMYNESDLKKSNDEYIAKLEYFNQIQANYIEQKLKYKENSSKPTSNKSELSPTGRGAIMMGIFLIIMAFFVIFTGKASGIFLILGGFFFIVLGKATERPIDTNKQKEEALAQKSQLSTIGYIGVILGIIFIIIGVLGLYFVKDGGGGVVILIGVFCIILGMVTERPIDTNNQIDKNT